MRINRTIIFCASTFLLTTHVMPDTPQAYIIAPVVQDNLAALNPAQKPSYDAIVTSLSQAEDRALLNSILPALSPEMALLFFTTFKPFFLGKQIVPEDLFLFEKTLDSLKGSLSTSLDRSLHTWLVRRKNELTPTARSKKSIVPWLVAGGALALAAGIALVLYSRKSKRPDSSSTLNGLKPIATPGQLSLTPDVTAETDVSIDQTQPLASLNNVGSTNTTPKKGFFTTYHPLPPSPPASPKN